MNSLLNNQILIKFKIHNTETEDIILNAVEINISYQIKLIKIDIFQKYLKESWRI